MYRSGPPRAAEAEAEADAADTEADAEADTQVGAGPGAGLRVRRVAARSFEGSSPTAQDPDLRVYIADMVAPYGLALREDMLAAGVGHNYGEMAAELIREAVPEDEPIDLLVLAYAIPDVRPGRSTALYLSTICPGEPLAFAVSEQGVGAAHTALKLARAYVSSGNFRRAMVVIVEQPALHYEPPRTPDGPPPPVPTGAAAVAVICDRLGTVDSVNVRQFPGQTTEGANALVGKEITALGGDRSRTVLILGSGLACVDLFSSGCRQIILANLGQPFTGQWAELAQGLPAWSAEGVLVLVADYDKQLGCLSLCVIDTAASADSDRSAVRSVRSVHSVHSAHSALSGRA